jgi:hypothetical protein
MLNSTKQFSFPLTNPKEPKKTKKRPQHKIKPKLDNGQKGLTVLRHGLTVS